MDEPPSERDMKSTCNRLRPVNPRRGARACVLVAGLVGMLSLGGCGGGGDGSEASPDSNRSARETVRYTLVAIAPLAHGVTARGLDRAGRVVGTLGSATSAGGFLWEAGNLAERGSQTLRAINDAGDVAGDSAGIAYLWTAAGVEQPLAYGSAHDVNDADQVVGEASTTGGHLHAFLWEQGSLRDLGTLGGSWSVAYAINASGQVTGWAEREDGTVRATLWEGAGEGVDLGSLGGAWSMAYALNDRGSVVGYAQTTSGNDHAFRTEASGVMRDLGTLGGDYSVAYDIDSHGRVIGEAATASGETHAFLWDEGAMVDLNDWIPSDSGWTLHRAIAINDAGQVVAEGVVDGEKRPCLLTPLP